MVSVNGIPQAFAPNNLAQRVANLERKLEERTSARTYVNLANVTVTEGGTIDAGVGDKLTETVKDKIVIDGGNLGEGALDGQRMVGAIIETNDAANRGVKIDDTGLRGYDADGNRYMLADESGLEMTGSISTLGKTAETVPRDIAVRLTTITRDSLLGGTYSSPALVFDDGVNLEGLSRAPGMYSPDGKSLIVTGRDAIFGKGTFQLSYQVAALVADRLILGDRGLSPTDQVDILANTIQIGDQGSVDILPMPAANVNLLGKVKVNGDRVMKTVTPNIPADQQPIELIANGSATTSSAGTFTINFPTNTFPTACVAIFIVPNSGGGVIPVVNGTGALTRSSCQANQPGNGNKSITYSYRAIGY